MNLAHITCVKDLEVLAKRRVPRMFYEYAASGSWTQQTLHANTDDFQRLLLRQRVAVDISKLSLQSTMLGKPVSMPVALAPTGLTGMQHADGEILAARAAQRFGVPYTLSTMSICSIEDVASRVDQPFWFQLYVTKDRKFTQNLLDRARAAEVSALVLTLDLQVMGQRHRDIKNGLSTPPKPTLRNLLNLATKPRWCWHMSRTPRRQFGNIVGHADGVTSMSSLAAWTNEQFDASLDWDDVARIKEQWGGKMVLKGILTPEDAELAVRHGADAVIVSNHGGRQLDGAPSTISVLPDIVSAIGSQTDVWLDSGIRTGQDVLRALALGAKGTLIGRAYLYGLGALGEAGVTRCLEIIAKELQGSMGLCGKTRVTDVDRSILHNL